MDIVKINTRVSGSGGHSAQLTIPKHVAEALAAAEVTHFTVEVTEEGLLFKPLNNGQADEAKPEWLKPKASPAARRRAS